MQNPFSISLGRTNKKLIQREQEIQPIFEDFNSENTRNTVYILTGPRGCGKTVTLGHILDEYRLKDNWVVARLSQDDNMLEQLASLLYENGYSKFKSLKVEFSFSFHGLTFKVNGDKPVSSIHVYLERLLEYFNKKGIHVLVAIDDVSKNKGMVDFIRAYQGFLIDHHDVRLLITGLAKNISKLEADRSLTFLYRAHKIRLSPLSMPSIASSYQETFKIDEKQSYDLAKLTKGYALAYQILGDILFRNNKKEVDSSILKEYDIKLNDWSYEMIWSELTESEKKILTAIANNKFNNQEIMGELNISKGNLAIYKKRLIDEGLINNLSRKALEFSLPRFDQFIITRNKYIEE